MNAEKLLKVMEVVVDHDPKALLSSDDEQLWIGIGPLEHLTSKAEAKLSKLGARLDHGRGWYVWL